MDIDDEERSGYEQVSPLEIGLDDEEDAFTKKAQHQQEEVDTSTFGFLHKTLLRDGGVSIRSHPLVEGSFTMKLLKFIFLTFLSITFVHLIVAHLEILGDRDRNLKLEYIWKYEGDLIVFDSVVFFLVGRLWKQKGVDHLAWILPLLLCNVYFESQQFFSWLRHSVTLYEMHCIWPWQLWTFVAILIPSIVMLVLLHVLRAYQKRILVMKIMELGLCAIFFVLPFAGSSYFHFHHW